MLLKLFKEAKRLEHCHVVFFVVVKHSLDAALEVDRKVARCHQPESVLLRNFLHRGGIYHFRENIGVDEG